jgi:hypothetical protein
MVGGYPGNNHRMPVCCAAMRAEMRAGDNIVRAPPSGDGANVVIEYRLPRSCNAAALEPANSPANPDKSQGGKNMSRIVLIECAAQQNRNVDKCRAEELYTSQLFRQSLAYARTLRPDEIFILSSNYGLLNLDDEVSPYDVNLREMHAPERRALAERILESLGNVSDMENYEYVILAGERAIEYITPHLKHHTVPMRGLRIGERLHWLDERLNR